MSATGARNESSNLASVCTTDDNSDRCSFRSVCPTSCISVRCKLASVCLHKSPCATHVDEVDAQKEMEKDLG